MVKRSTLFLSIILEFSSLISCENNAQKKILTYGSFIEMNTSSYGKSIIKGNALTSSQLFSKVENKEVFILYTFKDFSSTCGCLDDGGDIIRSLNNLYHLKVYTFDTNNIDNIIRDKISIIDEHESYFSIFEGNNLLARYSYTSNHSIFVNVDKLYTEITKVVTIPRIYYVDKNSLSNLIDTKTELDVAFLRNQCPDCSYLIPKIILPFVKEKQTKPLYFYDLQSFYDISNSTTASEEEKLVYQNIKDEFNLSFTSNEKYGYLQGVVPTIHHYNNKQLVDACVYANDSYEIAQDKLTFKISQSFYDTTRYKNLHYLDNIEDKILLNKTFSYKENMTRIQMQEATIDYHDAFITSYLDYYLKK